jgi:hypothetical protein
VVAPGLKGPPTPPPMSLAHFDCAERNAGDEGKTPLPSWKPPPGFGSGKLGTPLARMQLANASGPEPSGRDAVEPELAALDAVALTLAAVVLASLALAPVVLASLALAPVVLTSPTLAALVVEELAPHPASATTLRSVARASRQGRGERVGRCG